MNRPRNLIARSPLLRKGGVHRRPKSAGRFRAGRELARAIDALDGHDDRRSPPPGGR